MVTTTQEHPPRARQMVAFAWNSKKLCHTREPAPSQKQYKQRLGVATKQPRMKHEASGQGQKRRHQDEDRAELVFKEPGAAQKKTPQGHGDPELQSEKQSKSQIQKPRKRVQDN